MHYQLDQATSLSSQLTLDSCANAADRVLNYDSVKRPASQEMSGAEYGSPCVRYRDTWKGNTQAVQIGMHRCHDKTCLQAHNLTAFGTI